MAGFAGSWRLQLDEHVMTDVITGSFVGSLVGEFTGRPGCGAPAGRGWGIAPSLCPVGVALRGYF